MDNMSEFWFNLGRFTGSVTRDDVQKELCKAGYTQENCEQLILQLNNLISILYKGK